MLFTTFQCLWIESTLNKQKRQRNTTITGYYHQIKRFFLLMPERLRRIFSSSNIRHEKYTIHIHVLLHLPTIHCYAWLVICMLIQNSRLCTTFGYHIKFLKNTVSLKKIVLILNCWRSWRFLVICLQELTPR